MSASSSQYTGRCRCRCRIGFLPPDLFELLRDHVCELDPLYCSDTLLEVLVDPIPYGCLFSRVLYFRCFRGCIHDLRKLKKYQNFDPRMLTQQWRSLVASHGSCSVVRMKAISECRASFREARRDYNPSTSNDSAAKKNSNSSAVHHFASSKPPR